MLECLHDESGSAVMRSGWQTSDSELETDESPVSVGRPAQTGGRSPAEEEEGEVVRWVSSEEEAIHSPCWPGRWWP